MRYFPLVGAAIDAWCEDLLHHSPGDDDSADPLLARVPGLNPGQACIVLTHGSWLSTILWWVDHGEALPTAAGELSAPRHGALVKVNAR